MASWFSEREQPALGDLWTVYDANFEAVLGALQRVVPDREATARARERVRRAVAGGWEDYEAQLREEAAGYARRGLSFATWHGLVAAMYTHVTPLLVRAYASEPDRLSAALGALHQFGGRAIGVLGEGYLGEREAMSREKEHETERGRQRAEGRFARLVESGVIGVVVGNLDARIIEINEAAVAPLGYSREEILSGAVRWRDLTPPDWGALDDRARAELTSTGVGALREKEYLHKDGHRVPVLLGSAMIEGTDEVVSFILDLTHRKRAEAAVEHLRAVRAGEALFRTLVDSVTDHALFMLDADGRIVTWNRGAQRLKGYAEEEIVGKHFSVFYTPEDLADGLPAKQLIAATSEGRSECEGWRVRRDQSRFWADVVITAIKDTAGNVLGFAKITRDLSARKAAEKALNDSNKELEAFSYSVAHDLRAPLRGMSGFARVLLDTYGPKLDAEGKDWLEEILLNAKKMGALIDALLSLARVTRSELKVDHVDLSAVAHDVVARLAAGERERSVAVVIQPGLVADGDANVVRALLDNLMENAWKFSGRTQSSRIEVGAADAFGERTFFVRDNGAGFDMGFASKLFAPFQRLHAAAEFPGTGIGLATAQRIVHRHGGRIWAEGAVDVGATFYFTLPGAATGATA